MTCWRKVEQFPRYEVSDDGQVRSFVWDPNGRILKPRLKKNGYLQVTLSNETRKAVHISVHRLVADAFLEPDPDRPWVNHRNFIKTDNRATNLEWCTPTENNHATDMAGRRHASTNPNRARKLTAEKVAKLRELAAGGIRTGLLAKEFGISPSVARLVVRRKLWADPVKE